MFGVVQSIRKSEAVSFGSCVKTHSVLAMMDHDPDVQGMSDVESVAETVLPEHVVSGAAERRRVRLYRNGLRTLWEHVGAQSRVRDEQNERIFESLDELWSNQMILDHRIQSLEEYRTNQNLWDIVMFAVWVFWNKIQELCRRVGVPRLHVHELVRHIVEDDPEEHESTAVESQLREPVEKQ